MGDTTRKRKTAQMQHRLSVAVLSCALCPQGLPVTPYTARKKYTGWSGAALCQLRSHKCPYSCVAAFVGWLVGVFCDCHKSWRAIVGIIFRHQTYLSNQSSKKIRSGRGRSARQKHTICRLLISISCVSVSSR